MRSGISGMRLALCLLILGVFLVQGTVPIAAVDRATASWTFMVYLDGDNNLESCAVDDFMEMASIGSNAQVKIVVQFDRGTHSVSDGGSSSYGNWGSTKRFYVDQGETPTSANQVSDLGEANMGSAATLQSFLEWGMGSYPASNYALVLWDHGGAWVYGVCSDDSPDDCLLMPEVRQAISAAETSTGEQVNLVGFDACLMGMVEVAYDLRTYADTVVFSEETEPGQGWAYDKVLADLERNPSMASQQLGAIIVDEYSAFYGTSGKETLSAINTSALPSVSSALNSFASEMSSAYQAHSEQINVVRSEVEHFEYEMIVDMYDMAQRMKSAGITTQLSSAADQLISSIQGAVTREVHGDLRSGAHGLSLYFPDVRSDLNLVGYRSDILLTQDTSWDEFLETFFQETSSSDQYEPDNVFTQANQLMMDVPQYHSILGGGADVDWVYFTLNSTTEVVIETSGVSGDTELYLFTEAAVPSSYLAYNDDGGIDTFSRIYKVLPAGRYYLMVREYHQNEEINSYQLTIKIPLQADAFEPDDESAQANYIALNSSQLHSIGGGGADVDWVYFTLNTTQSVLIETWGLKGDTRIWFYREDVSGLNEINSDDDSSVGLFSRLVEVDLAPGNYYIEVQENYNDEEIESYNLNLSTFSLNDAFEPDGDYLHSTNLVPGEEQMHSIGSSGLDTDWFQFELLFDSDVHIETYGNKGDTVMSLFSVSGVPNTEIGMDDDSGGGHFSLLEMSNLKKGHYYVEIGAYKGYFGSEAIPEYKIILFTDPSSPLNLTTRMNGSVVELEWSVPLSNGGLPIDHYQVLRGLNGGAASSFRDVQGTKFIDDNVSAGEGYIYAVRAVTKFGGGKATEEVQIQIAVNVGAPSVIGALSVDQANDRISLSWSSPIANSSTIISYHVYRGTKSDASDRAEIGQSVGTSYIDSTVEKGKKYYYWVVAENGNGMGAMSTPTAATAINNGTLGGIALPLILALGVVIAVVAMVILLFARRSKAHERIGEGSRPMVQHGSQPQINVERCPNCGAPIKGMQFCGNCGRRLS